LLLTAVSQQSSVNHLYLEKRVRYKTNFRMT
jgi:hypothetical protein